MEFGLSYSLRILGAILITSCNFSAAGADEAGTSSEKQPILAAPRSSVETELYPHGTARARTLAPGQLAFQATPTAHAFQDMPFSFLLSSLNVGLVDRVEVGIVPLLYLIPGFYNSTAKVNYFNSQNFSASLGLMHMAFKLALWDRPMWFHSFSVSSIFNFQIPRSPLQFGFQVNQTFALNFPNAIDPDYFADVGYRLASRLYGTMGVSWMRKLNFDNMADGYNRQFGFGSSFTYLAPRLQLFFFPQVGIHYFPATAETVYFVSAYSR